MTMVVGLDVHREQITYDALDTNTGETSCGRIAPATRERLRAWLERFAGTEIEAALEATTGWRFVVEELERAGARAHLAEPAETRALRGPKRRAKTDRLDARHLRELLVAGRLPLAWIPPTHIQELRARLRLRQALVGERTAWQQRIHATLFHHGVAAERKLLVEERRRWLEQVPLPEAARTQVDVALRMIDTLNRELAPLECRLRASARRQPGCRALVAAHYGVGELTALALVCELGDVRRFGSSRRAVRHAGLDVTVSSSDSKRSRGRLSRQGSPLLRWAAYEAAQCAARKSSPDHAAYRALSTRLGHNRAKLTIARRLLRRAYHTLHELGDLALQPA